MDDLAEESIALLADAIDKRLETHYEYTFRPLRIDHIYCYITVMKSPKLFYIESIHIRCKISEENSERYILYYKYYDTMRRALDLIKEVAATYKLYNGDLVHPDDYALMQLEESIIPYEPDQQCCVCREPTQEQTLCRHYLCFHCRDACVSKKQLNCPVCRQFNVVKYFHIDNYLLNNIEYDVVKQIRLQRNMYYLDDSDEQEDETTEQEDETAEQEPETLQLSINNPITPSSDEYERMPIYHHHAPFMFWWNYRRNY